MIWMQKLNEPLTRALLFER